MENDSNGNPPEAPKTDVLDNTGEPEHNMPETTEPETLTDPAAEAQPTGEELAPKSETVDETPVEPEAPIETTPASEETSTAEAEPAKEVKTETEPVDSLDSKPADTLSEQPDYDPVVAAAPKPASEPTPEIKAALANLDDTSPVISLEPPQGSNAKKSKGPLVALVAILLLALGGAGYWYFFLNKPEQPISDDQHHDVLNPDEKPATLRDAAGNQLTDFDLSFLKLEDMESNLVYSPLSIKYALLMLEKGTDGDSKTQINKYLGDYNPRHYLNSANLSLANVLFVRDEFSGKVLDSYKTDIDSSFGAQTISDPFADATNINNWISEHTFNQINNTLEDDQVSNPLTKFALVNALAIDMNWKNKLQCSNLDPESDVPCIDYHVNYAHENYYDSVGGIKMSYPSMTFNGHENTKSVAIGASINRYDIINELGEDHIRETVQQAYQDWLASEESKCASDTSFNIDTYIEELKANYKDVKTSTDFYEYTDDSVKVLAKDLREYDGTTLQYVSIMPKEGSLANYIDNTDAGKINNILSNLESIELSNFKEGVVTKIKAQIPLFSFNYNLKLRDDLKELGIEDVFDEKKANLSNLVVQDKTTEGLFITDAVHKANIEFTNLGIKAAATTVFIGGMGAAGPCAFEYNWDVPVEEIDLTFDQPFLFLIRDKSSGEIWFTGTVYEGTENTEE